MTQDEKKKWEDLNEEEKWKDIERQLHSIWCDALRRELQGAKCLACQFWQEDRDHKMATDNDHHAKTSDSVVFNGTCRKYGPAFGWPVTRFVDWCGDFEPLTTSDVSPTRIALLNLRALPERSNKS